jgi:hypothetical protein
MFLPELICSWNGGETVWGPDFGEGPVVLAAWLATHEWQVPRLRDRIE